MTRGGVTNVYLTAYGQSSYELLQMIKREAAAEGL